MLKLSSKKIRRILKDLFQGLLVILGSVLFALALRIFLFASFKIPSPSMTPSIEAGDFILVNKLIPGPRVYKNFDFLKGSKIETRRFKGVRPIRRNDILVFNFPYVAAWTRIKMDLNVNYVKRCIAIPGDTFYIDNGIYRVKNSPDSLGYLPYQQELSEREDSRFSREIFRCFPYDSIHYNWTIKNFGPLYIPKAGDDLTMDTVNYRLYKNLIEYETDQELNVKDGAVCLDDSVISRYTFRLNYYFMSGDWVFDSRDSRYWGLLPEDHIIGKASLIWRSQDMQTGTIRWKRFFKKVK